MKRLTGLCIGLVVLAACGTNPSDFGGSEPASEGGEGDAASCALVVEFRGDRYEGHSVQIAPEEGEPLGSAILPPCEEPDGAESSRGERIEVAALPGVSPRRAIVWRGRDDTVLVRKGESALPPEVDQLLDAPTCDEQDAPISVSGPWLGILGADEKTELDMKPPYDVDLFVEEASKAPYERAFLTVRVPRRLGRPLNRQDVKSSLWEGGNIDIVARCNGKDFVAQQVSVYPPN